MIVDVDITAFTNLMLKSFIAGDFGLIVSEHYQFLYKPSALVAVTHTVYIPIIAPLFINVRILIPSSPAWVAPFMLLTMHVLLKSSCFNVCFTRDLNNKFLNVSKSSFSALSSCTEAMLTLFCNKADVNYLPTVLQ